MNRFKKILFFADGAKGEKAALSRALDLARHNGADLNVIAIVPEVGTNDDRLHASISRLQQTLIRERRDLLEALLKDVGVSPSDGRVTSRVVPAEKGFIEIIRTVTVEKFDLLIKSVDSAGAMSKALFGNNDLRLLRQCPSPVWIIKPGRRKKIHTILAAVDLTNEEPESIALAKRITQIATGIAGREGSTLHVLAAWKQPLDPVLGRRLNSDTYKQIIAEYKDQVRSRFDQLVDSAQDSPMLSHLVRQEPGAAITGFVADYDVDLLVMGTLSRSGIPGLLIGNTAERVLSHVDCSVLTLKPPGFKPNI